MIKIAEQAALAAGKILKKHYAKQRKIIFKDDGSIITETDLASEKKIISIITKAFPNHKIFSEEAGFSKKYSDYIWIIDPLDGTTNFSRGIPYFAVSIALTHKNKVISGVIYDPIQNELFSAEHGKGCMRNNIHIHRATANTPDRQTISLERGRGPDAKKRLTAIFNAVATTTRSIRIPGATALNLAHLADNRLDALINSDCNFYDCAAGCLIATAAGVTITDFNGKPWQLDGDARLDILAADQKYIPHYCELLKNI